MWNCFLHVDVSHACSTQRANKTQLSAKSPIPFFLLFATLQRYSMFLLQVLQAAKALLFLFPHSFPFDGCSTCCLIFFVFCFCFLFQKWPWSSPLSALSKRAKFEAQGRSVKLWNTCQTHTKHCTQKKKKRNENAPKNSLHLVNIIRAFCCWNYY